MQQHDSPLHDFGQDYLSFLLFFGFFSVLLSIDLFLVWELYRSLEHQGRVWYEGLRLLFIIFFFVLSSADAL